MNIEQIKQFIIKKHEGQTRKDNVTPFHTHPIAVAKILEENGFGEEHQIIGLLHDTVEDTDTTYEEITELTNKEIAEIVRLLTKEEGYDIEEYFETISNNPIARDIKIADRIHNLSETYYLNIEFRKKYLKETEEYFIQLSAGTKLEERLKQEMEKVRRGIQIEEEQNYER